MSVHTGVLGIAGEGRTQKIKPLADLLLDVLPRDTQRVQEVHILLGQIFCELVERHLPRR